MVCRAFREACSPANMVSASLLWLVLRKKCLGVPSGRVVVIFAVVVKPEPPCEAIVVLEEEERERARRMAGSSFILKRIGIEEMPGA